MTTENPFRAIARDLHEKCGHNYSEYPYILHLDIAYSFFERFSYLLKDTSTEIRVGAAVYYHDLLEDCRVSYEDLGKVPPYDTAEIVYAVSSELGKNRSERNRKTYPKIKGNLEATFVKLCDRLANVSFSYTTGSHKFEMYRREYEEFRRELFLEELEPMFKEIENILNLSQRIDGD